MPTKNKYYAVAKGREVGIFTDYENSAKKSVDKFSNNAHAGFVTLREALQYMLDEGIHEPDIIGNISEDVQREMRDLAIYDNYYIENRARRRNPIAAAGASLEPNPETEPTPETYGEPCFCGEDASRQPDTLTCVKCQSIVHKTCTYFLENENRGNGYICERCKRRYAENPVVAQVEDGVSALTIQSE